MTKFGEPRTAIAGEARTAIAAEARTATAGEARTAIAYTEAFEGPCALSSPALKWYCNEPSLPRGLS